MEYQGVTRREAIAVAGIGTAAATMLSNVAMAQEQAVEAAPSVEIAPTEYLEADIIIAGAGGTGLAAALSAGYYGAESVLVLEKDRTTGGNTLLSHGSVTVVNPPDYARAPLTPELQSYLDEILQGGPINESEEAVWDELMAQYEDWCANGDPTKCFGSALFTSVDFARKDGVTVDWEYVLYGRLDEFFDCILPEIGGRLTVCYGGSGYPWPTSSALEGSERGEGWINGLVNAIEEKGYPVDLRLSTPVTSLIVNDDGDVLGVNAIASDGHRVAAYARRGVVLAMGGFTASHELLKQYNVRWPYRFIANCKTDGASTLTGDGILMSQAIGAAVGDMTMIQFLTQCDAVTGAENTLIGDRLRTLLRVSHEGVRFCREDASRNGMTEAILGLPEQECLQISDNTNSLVVDGVSQFGVPVATLQSIGSLYIADTIEELGEMFGADPAVFAQTVENYNKYCDEQNDPELGNTLVAPNCKLLEPPFYAYRIAPACHITYGGLATSENFEVQKNDYETIIKGLYAVGENRAGNGGVDVGLPDGYYVSKHLMLDVEPQDRSEAIAAAKAAEAEAQALEAAASQAKAVEVSYADGTYVGAGYGIGGEINVTLEIKDGVISVADISPNNETVGVGGYEAIEDGLFAKLVEDAQGANFDTIAGVTMTSNAIQTAVSQALEAAQA